MKNLIILVLLAALVGAALGPATVTAQDGVDAYTSYTLNLRAGPGVDYAVIGVLQSRTGLVFEATNSDRSWLLGHTADSALRGWVASLYLSYEPGFTAARLPLSEEVLSAPAQAAPTAPDAAASAPGAPAPAGPDESVIPAISPRVREILQRGQALGNHPHVFTKVGDCNANSEKFLGHPFALGNYDLGPYGHLQATIDHFAAGNSFWADSAAADPGFSIRSVTDSTYANPQQCPGGDAPLACDFRVYRPSVILVTLNMGDAMWLGLADYEAGLRNVITQAIEAGVVPVLITMPVHNRPHEFNAVMTRLAAAYDVPLLDFARAAGGLPNHGMLGGGDVIHLSGVYSLSAINFTGDQHVYGLTLLNLLALQTLDRLRAAMP